MLMNYDNTIMEILQKITISADFILTMTYMAIQRPSMGDSVTLRRLRKPFHSY